MNHTPDLLNHPALRPYKDSICATARPCAEITLLPAEHLTVWQSKLGGQPYWPKDMEYPRNAKGRPLHLLAQINFAEMPPLPDFPEEGFCSFILPATLECRIRGERTEKIPSGLMDFVLFITPLRQRK